MAQRDQTLELSPIGVVRSPHFEASGTPIQPTYADDVSGEIEIDERYEAALADLDGFERIWIVYWMDRAGPFKPRVVPYRDTVERGLFATRSPSRPNPIGISAVRLLARRGRTLEVAGLDVLDGTPLLDIKPYVPAFDSHPASRAGWLDATQVDRTRADGRFHTPGGRLAGASLLESPECKVRPGEVVLELGQFCIETTARRAREALVGALLSGEADGREIELAVELLEEFLRGHDFGALRAADPDLAGGRSCAVIIARDASGAVGWHKGG